MRGSYTTLSIIHIDLGLLVVEDRIAVEDGGDGTDEGPECAYWVEQTMRGGFQVEKLLDNT